MKRQQPTAAIVLAAGEGVRMKSATPKVLHSLAGRTLLGHAMAACASLHPGRLAVVVRSASDAVARHAAEVDPSVVLAEQTGVKGTGRAVQCAMSVLDALAMSDAALREPADDSAESQAALTGAVVVTSADAPMADGSVLSQLLAAHGDAGGAITMLTTRLKDPSGYGRIIRDADTGDVVAVVEHRDASETQLEIDEINASVYVFEAKWLRYALERITADNRQGEMYLTDAIAIVRAAGGVVRAFLSKDPWVAEGVNDRVQLAELTGELNRRLVRRAMLDGVTVQDPSSTWIDVDVELEPDVTLLPGTFLRGRTVIRTGAVVGPDTTLIDTEVHEGAVVQRSVVTSSQIGPGATVGPFSYIRPGTSLGEGGKIGAFVETKNAQIGQGSKVPHLSYVGDATIGRESNIGAATIFANYDGVRKHHTTVGSFVRVGSDNILVAPVTIGDGAYTGAGSTIRHDVPPGALGLNSAPQRNVEGWVVRRRPDSAAARAAQEALGPGDSGSGDDAGAADAAPVN